MVADLQLPLGSRCIKYLMFTFNLLFVITGIILISIGVTIRVAYDDYKHLLDDKFFSLPTFLIVVGSFIFFIAFFGCCGAVRENYCMILTFTALLILIFIMELSGGIAGYVLRKQAAEVIESKMKSTIDDCNKKNETGLITMWSEIQTRFDCCGISNESDWVHGNVTDLPMSCCSPRATDRGYSTCDTNSENLRKVGCLDAFSVFIKSHAVQLGGVGIGLAFVQAIGIWFAIYLARAIKLSYETV